MKRSLTMALLLSVALHLLIFGGMAVYALATKPPLMPETVTLEILDQQPETKLEIIKEKTKTKIDKTSQIVEQEDKALNQDKVEDARYLSAHNQKVLKQTQAANHGEFQNLKTKTVKAGKPVENKKSALPSLNHLLAAYDPMATGFKKQEAKTNQEAEAAQKGGSVSQTSDYLKDIDQGIETLLNTREFKYYTYYNRIRKQLSQFWEPKVREKVNIMFQQGRKVASAQDRITKLLIVLNSRGTLVNVKVISDSGVRDLDDAAVEAFRAAAPFPNPPKGIIETDGTVKIRWDFVLET
ncbi:MAG TPA: energy transducer TonB [Pseudobdellovibrionaceae bacterium]|jgi:protein TonB